MFRLLVSAGGTGGGVYPALAVVRALSGKSEVAWVGGEGGMEADLVRRAGVDYEAIPAAGLHGVGLARLPGNLLRLARGYAAARRIVARRRPDVMFFTGGYVGVPLALAGRGVRKLAFVPDLEPGLALRTIARMADVVALTAEPRRRQYPASARLVVTGYPVRPDLRRTDRGQARRHFSLPGEGPVVLIVGGSQGAHSINLAVWRNLEPLLRATPVIHLTGAADAARAGELRAALPPDLASRYLPFGFLHDEMGLAMSAADLAVSRAGASVLGELPAFSLPSVLVPYPHAWRYQATNAEHMRRQGAAVILHDADLPRDLLRVVTDLLRSPDRLAEMSRRSAALAAPGAAQALASQIERLAAGRD